MGLNNEQVCNKFKPRWTMCGISVHFLKYGKIGVNEVKRALFQQKSENLSFQNGQLYGLKSRTYHTFI